MLYDAASGKSQITGDGVDAHPKSRPHQSIFPAETFLPIGPTGRGARILRRKPRL